MVKCRLLWYTSTQMCVRGNGWHDNRGEVMYDVCEKNVITICRDVLRYPTYPFLFIKIDVGVIQLVVFSV